MVWREALKHVPRKDFCDENHTAPVLVQTMWWGWWWGMVVAVVVVDGADGGDRGGDSGGGMVVRVVVVEKIKPTVIRADIF